MMYLVSWQVRFRDTPSAAGALVMDAETREEAGTRTRRFVRRYFGAKGGTVTAVTIGGADRIHNPDPQGVFSLVYA
jgi:hypothetical protein